jgi:hypothetical protein
MLGIFGAQLYVGTGSVYSIIVNVHYSLWIQLLRLPIKLVLLR